MVSRQTVLDLSHLTSPEQLATITRIERVAAVVVRQSLAAGYAKIPSERVGATIYLPDDEQVRVRAHTGMLTVGGDGLGAPEDVLVVVGLLVVTSPVTGPVPQRIHVIGSVIAPRGSEPALGPALAATTGTVSYYPYAEGQEVKVLAGQVQLSGASLANPTGQPDDLLIAAGQVVVTASARGSSRWPGTCPSTTCGTSAPGPAPRPPSSASRPRRHHHRALGSSPRNGWRSPARPSDGCPSSSAPSSRWPPRAA